MVYQHLVQVGIAQTEKRGGADEEAGEDKIEEEAQMEKDKRKGVEQEEEEAKEEE